MYSHTPSEAAVYLSGSKKPVSLKTLQRWRAAGIGPSYIKVGGRIRYSTEALQRYLDKNTIKCGGAE